MQCTSAIGTLNSLIFVFNILPTRKHWQNTCRLMRSRFYESRPVCIVAKIRGSFLELEFCDFFHFVYVRLVFGKYKTRYHNILHEWFNLQLCFGKFRINLRIKSLSTLCCVWHNVGWWLYTTSHKEPFFMRLVSKSNIGMSWKMLLFLEGLYSNFGEMLATTLKLQKDCRCCWWHMFCLTRFFALLAYLFLLPQWQE